MTHLALSALVTLVRRALAVVANAGLHGVWLLWTIVVGVVDRWGNMVPG